MKKQEIRDDYEDRIEGIHGYYHLELGKYEEEYVVAQASITEYEADLNAAKARAEIAEGDRDILESKLDTALDNYAASHNREQLLRDELVKANNSWMKAKQRVCVVNEDNAKLERERDTIQASWEAQRQELADVRGQLSRIRAAEDGLHKACYPGLPTLGLFPPAITGIVGGTTLGPLTTWNAGNYEDVEDRLDRLHEAGYSCATGKRAQAEAVGYAGLS